MKKLKRINIWLNVIGLLAGTYYCLNVLPYDNRAFFAPQALAAYAQLIMLILSIVIKTENKKALIYILSISLLIILVGILLFINAPPITYPDDGC